MLLSVENLSVSFDTEKGRFDAVKDISFELNQGEILGIVGESGSGKSMSALAIMKLLPDNAILKLGSMIFDGIDISKYDDRQMSRLRGKDISIVFQNPMAVLNPGLRIGAQLAESLMIHEGMSKKEALEKSFELLQAVGIASAKERIHEYPHQMSGGILQRVLIAMAIACRPKLIIADEPTTALDASLQSHILRLLTKQREDYNTSIILISHDIGLIAHTTDRVLVMQDACIKESNYTEELIRNPRDEYTKHLINTARLLSS